jgi:hypothetical protein
MVVAGQQCPAFLWSTEIKLNLSRKKCMEQTFTKSQNIYGVLILLIGLSGLLSLGLALSRMKSFSTAHYTEIVDGEGVSQRGLERYQDLLREGSFVAKEGWTAACAIPKELRTIGVYYWQAVSYHAVDETEQSMNVVVSVPITESDEMPPIGLVLNQSGTRFLVADQTFKFGQVLLSSSGKSHYIVEVTDTEFVVSPPIEESEIKRDFLWIRNQSSHILLNIPHTNSTDPSTP